MVYKNRSIQYHEKHGAWVISRPINIVHLTGGSWFYPERFKTEEEIKAYIDTLEEGEKISYYTDR